MSSVTFNPEQVSAFIDDSPFAVFLISDVDNQIIWANMTAQEWFQRSLKKMQLDVGLSGLTMDYGDFLSAINRVKATGGAVSIHNCILRLPKSEDELKVNFTAYETRAGIALMIRRVEAGPSPDAGHSADSAVSALGRMLAHELKNPLAGIRGAAQLLSTEIHTDEGRELIALIKAEIDRLKRLADKMERFGDANSINAHAVNIHSILRKARLMAENSTKKDIVFSEVYDPSLPFALGDEDALMQAVLNLVKNAVEAITLSHQSGEIVLETNYRAGVTVSSGEDQRQALPIEIKIIDDGPGVSDTIRREIFHPFITDKPNGQGLGLSMVSKIVTMHGGLIDMKSRPGRTVFSILLPVFNQKESLS